MPVSSSLRKLRHDSCDTRQTAGHLAPTVAASGNLVTFQHSSQAYICRRAALRPSARVIQSRRAETSPGVDTPFFPVRYLLGAAHRACPAAQEEASSATPALRAAELNGTHAPAYCTPLCACCGRFQARGVVRQSMEDGLGTVTPRPSGPELLARIGNDAQLVAGRTFDDLGKLELEP